MCSACLPALLCPAAAASLGQVYKGRLHTGEAVAVKVQRPYVLETVTVDLFIIRRIGLALREFPQFTQVRGYRWRPG